MAHEIQVRYIKLGESGKRESYCIHKNLIYLGYPDSREQAKQKDWDAVQKIWDSAGHMHQIRDFHTLTEEDYFITFHDEKMYWCQPKGEAFEIEIDGKLETYRNTKDGWHCLSQAHLGQKDEKFFFYMSQLDGGLTKVRGFRGTICEPSYPKAKLLELIKTGVSMKDITEAKELLENLKEKLKEIIKSLNPQDLEFFIDLNVGKLGWGKVEAIGGTKKDYDIVATYPITRERLYIQIKASTNFGQFKEYLDRRNKEIDFYYVYAQSDDDNEILKYANKENRVYVWNLDTIVNISIETGTMLWLLDRK